MKENAEVWSNKLKCNMSALADRYVIPLSDVGFKKLFGTEPDQILLTDLISRLISEKHRMKELTFLENELLHFLELKNQRCEVFYDKLKFIYIELPKFRKSESELETHFDKWLYVFRHLSQLQDRPQALQEKIFQKLFEAAEIARFTPKEREIYEDSLKYYRDMKNVVDTAREEGREKGRENGREEGEKEGLLEMARTMKKAGESLEKIRQYTGLSDQEIERLV